MNFAQEFPIFFYSIFVYHGDRPGVHMILIDQGPEMSDNNLNSIGLFRTFYLDDFEFYRQRYRALQEIPPTAAKVLDCFKERPEIRLQRLIIIEDTGLPRTTVTDALRILREWGFIQRLGRGAGIRYQLIF
jgi:hypothetical protein